MSWYLWFVIGIIVGVTVTGVFSAILVKVRTSYGTLKIDHSNPEKDVYRFEIDDIENLHKKKFIVLKIDNDADLSQK